MKARVKETGEIVEVVHYSGYGDYDYICHENESVYDAEELEFEDAPDYWTRLEHQVAIAAMQGIWTNPYLAEIPSEKKVQYAYETSHALVEKLKEKEERK